MTKTGLKHTLAAALILSFMAGTAAHAADKASKAEPAPSTSEVSDPLESVNRAIFGFNMAVDKVFIEPLAKGYNFVLPRFARDGIQSFLRNIKSPLTVANDLLQGNIGNAGTDTARFVINSTVGLLGFVDVAEAQGLPYRDEDFGQTLAVWGVGSGPYIVLPILGPSTVRDTTGLAVDSYADPVRIALNNHEDGDLVYLGLNALEGLDNRSRLLKAVDDLRANSLDFYAAVRSAYVQKRDTLIRNKKPGAADDDFLNDEYLQ